MEKDIFTHRYSNSELQSKAQRLQQKYEQKERRLKELARRHSMEFGEEITTSLQKVETLTKKTVEEKKFNKEKFEQDKRDLLKLNEELKQQKELEKEKSEREKRYEQSLREIQKLQLKMEQEKRDLEEYQTELQSKKTVLDKRIHNFEGDSASESVTASSDSEISDSFGGGSVTHFREQYTETFSASSGGRRTAKPVEVVTKQQKLDLNSCKIAVLVGACKNLRKPKNMFGVVRPFIVLVVKNTKKKGQPAEEGSLNPVFKSKFQFSGVNLEKDRFILEVRNRVLVQRQRFGVLSKKFSEIFEMDKLQTGKNEVSKTLELDGEGNGQVLMKFIVFIK